MTRGVQSAAAAALALLAAGCGATTVETDQSPTTVAGATTIAPSGDPAELLDRLRDRSFVLSAAIVAGDEEDDRVIEEIDALWAAFTGAEARTQFVVSAESQIANLRHAVERRRPADADKAARNLSALIDAR